MDKKPVADEEPHRQELKLSTYIVDRNSKFRLLGKAAREWKLFEIDMALYSPLCSCAPYKAMYILFPYQVYTFSKSSELYVSDWEAM